MPALLKKDCEDLLIITTGIYKIVDILIRQNKQNIILSKLSIHKESIISFKNFRETRNGTYVEF